MKKLHKVVEYFLAIAFLLLIWQLYIWIFNVPEYMLASPARTAMEIYELIISGEVLSHFFVTSTEILAGFIFGVLLGVFMGYIIGKVRILEEALMPYILLAQTAPKIALAPLFVIWFGLGFVSKLVLVISMVFFPVMVGMILGLKSISTNLKYLMQITRLNWWQKLWHVELMHSLPYIFAGLKVGMVQAVIAAIVAEWISGESGLGYLLIYSSTTYNLPMLFAGIFFTVIVGIIFYQIVEWLENRYLFWHESKLLD